MKQKYFRHLLTIVNIMLCSAAYGQMTQYCIGDAGNQLATRVRYMASDGSTIIGGYSYDIAGGAGTNCQAILMKVTSLGTIAWQKTFGVPARNNIIMDMIITQDNNIVVVGTVGGTGAVYADNTAAILKFKSTDGTLMWQKCFRDAATTTGGELFYGVTELTDGTGRLVAVGSHNNTGPGADGMICVFQSTGTLIYNDVYAVASGDEYQSVVTSADGASVYMCGEFVGDYKDGRVMSYTPGATTGVINWVKYFNFYLLGTLQDNFFTKIELTGSTLVVSSGSLHNYSTTSGSGHAILTLSAIDGSGAQLYGIQNSGAAYANSPGMAVASADHIFTIQSPATAMYDAMLWTPGVTTNTVLTEITSLTGHTTNPPVRFTSTDVGQHSIQDIRLNGGMLYLAGATNVTSGYGNNDMYFVATSTGLSSTNNTCDTVHDVISITTPAFTSTPPAYTNVPFTPVYSTVDTSTSHYSIKAICGDNMPTAACNALTVPDSLHLCFGDTATIHASLTGGDSVLNYIWSPATGLSSTTILDPVVTATTSGWYYLTVNSILPGNLVVNGDFSAGNTGFGSSYLYSAPPSTTLVEGHYSVYNNPFGVHTGFTVMGDHTTGTGNMMIINGSSTASSVWCQTISVVPNTDYDFSAWFANCSGVTTGAFVPILQFMVNGVLLGTPTSVTAPPGTWVNFFSTWNSGTSTTATICIYDETTAASGNDFVIDDISFKEICVAKDSVYLMLNPPTVTTIHSDTSVCTTVGTITLTSPSGYDVHIWNTGDTSLSITVGTSGIYWVVDSTNCTKLIDTFHVTFTPPTVVTSHVDTTVCASLINIVLNAPAGYTSPTWSTGATTSSITISTAGAYWVSSTSNCITRVDTFDVTFRASPVVNLGNDTAFCMGDSVILTSLQPVGDTFLWSTGATTDSIHVTASGSYTLTVSNGCKASDAVTITVSPHPLVNLGPDTSECSGDPVVLHSLNTYVGPTYLWSDATSGATTTATATGTYWLQVTVAGCSGADTVHVTILYDTLTLYNHDTAICKGKSVQVLTTGTIGQTYLWTPIAGIASPMSGSPLITPDTSATYVLTTFFPGCPDLVDSFRIDVQPTPQVYLGGNRSVCENDTLHITASVTPAWYTGYIYTWSPSVSLDNSITSTVVFTAGDSTNIILTVTTPAGCKGVDSAELIVHPSNFVNYDTSISVCPGGAVQLTPMALNGIGSYTWHPGMYLSDSTSPAPWVYAITSQHYWAVVVNQYGCFDTVSANITVRPAAVLNLGDSVTLFPGETYQISPQTNCVNFVWTPPAGLSNPYVSNPLATPLINTKYVVYGTTEWGCSTSDSINIYISEESELALPNAFTPGNGPNNVFKVLKRGVANLSYFRVYNRWGNLVFQTSNIDEGWDGTYHDVPQPFGVYVYQVEAVTSTGKVFQKVGNVTLIR